MEEKIKFLHLLFSMGLFQLCLQQRSKIEIMEKLVTDLVGSSAASFSRFFSSSKSSLLKMLQVWISLTRARIASYTPWFVSALTSLCLLTSRLWRRGLSILFCSALLLCIRSFLLPRTSFFGVNVTTFFPRRSLFSISLTVSIRHLRVSNVFLLEASYT